MTQNQWLRFTARSLPPRGQKNNQPRHSQAYGSGKGWVEVGICGWIV